MSFLEKIGNFFFGWLMPDLPSQEVQGAELTKASTEAFIPKIYGKVKNHPGTIIFKATNDVNDDDIENELLHIVIVWAESVQSIDKVYVDDIDIESNSDLFVIGSNRYAYARNFPNGMDNYTYDLLTDAGWRATDKCSGKACTYIRLQYANGENTLRSEPNFTADITGTSTSNPATVLQDYLTADRYGKDLSTTLLDIPAFTAAAAACNLQVEKVKDSMDMRSLFTINTAIDTGQSVFDNTNKILKAMRALMPISNGKLKPIVEKDDPAVSVPILENDIIELGDIRNSSKRNRYNRVVVTYLDEDAKGTKQEAVYPPKDSQIETDLLAEDNGVLLETTVKLETCNNYYEALALAKTFLEISREQLSTSVTLDLWATIYEVGDIVEVTHSVPGFAAKPFRITSITETDYQVELELREHQPAIYDFENTGLKPTYPDTSNELTRPATPANVTKLDVYNNLKQIDITWTGTTTRYSYVVKTALGEFIDSGAVARKKVELRNLAQDNYNIKIYAINAIGLLSAPASFDFTIDQEQNFFTWRVFAESETGLNISEIDNTNKTHIGLSPGQTISQASATSAAILAANYAYIPKPSGASATDGKSFATVSFFQRAASPPAKPADNSASFNFGTGVIVPPAGWSTTIPTGSNPLYVTTSTFGITGATGTDTTSTFSNVAKLAQDGADAPITKSYRTILIRRRSASALNTPTGGSYNFTTNTLTPPAGWVEGIPTGTTPIYESVGIASVNGSTGIDSVITWSAPAILVRDGQSATVTRAGNVVTISAANGSVQVFDGNDGDAAPIPTLTDNGDGTYTINNNAGQTLTFSDGEKPELGIDYFVEGGDYISNIFRNAPTRPDRPLVSQGGFDGTSETFPSGWTDNPTDYAPPDKRWFSTRRYSMDPSDSSYTGGVWSLPALQAENGTSGLNSATISLFRREINTPSVPSTNVTYTFSTGNTTGVNNSWSRSIPAGTDPVYITTGTAISTGNTDVITPSEWATPQILAQNGANGISYTGTIEYYKLTNTTTPPTIASGGWLTNPQTPTPSNRYLWNYNSNTRSSGAAINSPVSLITQYVKDGKGITSITEEYQRGTSATVAPTSTWSSTFSGAGALTVSLPYMWNRTTISYTEGANTVVTTMIAARGGNGDSGITATIEAPLGTQWKRDSSGNYTPSSGSNIPTNLPMTAKFFKNGVEVARGTRSAYIFSTTENKVSFINGVLDAGVTQSQSDYAATRTFTFTYQGVTVGKDFSMIIDGEQGLPGRDGDPGPPGPVASDFYDQQDESSGSSTSIGTWITIMTINLPQGVGSFNQTFSVGVSGLLLEDTSGVGGIGDVIDSYVQARLLVGSTVIETVGSAIGPNPSVSFVRTADNYPNTTAPTYSIQARIATFSSQPISAGSSFFWNGTWIARRN